MISPVILLSLALLAPDSKQEPEKAAALPAVLIDPAGLEARLKSGTLQILDVRSAGDFDRAHIPGAARVDVGRWNTLSRAKGGFENTSAWSREVGKLGIDRKTSVVVYGDRPTDTARVWWMLKYLGVERVLFLDGGWALWQKEKRPTTAVKAVVKPVDFRPEFQKDRLATIAEVKKAARDGSLVIVDVRSDREFDGGRVPGAVHVEWKRLMTGDGRFRSPEEIRTILGSCGLVKGKPLVPY